MPIVGGLDIHRKQITFDYLDTVTGQVQRGQISPADREHLRVWLARFAGQEDVAFAVEGCRGGGMSWRSWPRPASRRIWPSRPIPRSPAAASATPRPTRPTADSRDLWSAPSPASRPIRGPADPENRPALSDPTR
jgi:hypothetical protein